MRLDPRFLPLLFISVASLQSGCASLDQLTGGNARSHVAKEQLRENLDSSLARGRSLERSGDWDKAAKLYDRLLDEHQADWRIYHRAGVVADKQKRFQLAQRRYTQAIQLNPRHGLLFNDLGYCLYLQGKLEKAESALAKAVALDPDSSRFRNNYGMVLGHQERMEEAFAQFAKAGSEADAFYNVAFIYASNDNQEAATDCFRLALETDPTHEKARDALDAFARDARGQSIAPGDGRLVRYDESEDGSGTENAAFVGSLPDNRAAGAATRQLHHRARSSLNNRMSSQRNESQGQ